MGGAAHDPRAVATFAAYRVLAEAFPSRQSSVYDRAVRAQFAAAVEAGTFTAPAVAGAQALGFGAADAVMAARLGDGVNAFGYKFVPATEAPDLTPGRYRRTPAAGGAMAQMSWFAPQLGSALSFSWPAADGHDMYHALPTLEAFMPLTVGNPDYASNVAFVLAKGGHKNLTTTTRSPEQTATAMFWMQGEGSSGPAGQWLTAAARRVPATATELQRAELYAR